MAQLLAVQQKQQEELRLLRSMVERGTGASVTYRSLDTLIGTRLRQVESELAEARAEIAQLRSSQARAQAPRPASECATDAKGSTSTAHAGSHSAGVLDAMSASAAWVAKQEAEISSFAKQEVAAVANQERRGSTMLKAGDTTCILHDDGAEEVELSESMWDTTVFIGTPQLETKVSVYMAFFLGLNILMQGMYICEPSRRTRILAGRCAVTVFASLASSADPHRGRRRHPPELESDGSGVRREGCSRPA